MSIPRAAVEVRIAVAAACLFLLPGFAAGQAPVAAPAQGEGDELIAAVRTNGVRRGEFTLLRRPDGDFWIAAQDLPALRLEPREQARRQLGPLPYYSARSLGAQRVDFDEAGLTLDIDFRPDALQGTVLNLSTRPPSVPPDTAGRSLILSYHLSVQNGFEDGRVRALLENDLNLRLGPVLLRQETRLDSSAQRRFTRGVTQALWDDRVNARRWILGDVLSSAGGYGSSITGGGLLVAKLYDLTPDVLKQPTATLQATAALPSEVEVAVDGNTVYRTRVGPGPITLGNLALNGGTQNVRVTVTDATGRRQVVEQPFLFTDAALAQGLHEYSYFVGKRSELGAAGEWKYRENAWQGFHRYGLTDAVTVSGGGEGSRDFSNAGAGVTLRSDRFGLLSADLLASTDHDKQTSAHGWSLRYSYLLPVASFLLARRRFDEGFRSFSTNDRLPFVREETRIAAARQIGPVALSFDLVRSIFPHERRDTAILHAGTRITRTVSLSGEYQRMRVDGKAEWLASVYVRAELDGQAWVNTAVRSTGRSHGVDLEAGKPLPPAEGLGYRVGVSHTSGEDASSYAYAAADWNLRSASLDFFASAPVRGGGPSYAQVGVSGALVALGGYWGVTRRVSDGFAVASLGVPQAGVEVLLNNQLQGTTDAEGKLFIPQVGSFGRQDVAINDTQLDIAYGIDRKLRTIMPAYRSGTLVDFGGRRLRAVAGNAWIVREGRREAVATRAWTLRGDGRELPVRTGREGDFYAEDVVPGNYEGRLDDGQRAYACRLTIPAFQEPVHELREGIVCE